MAREQPYHSNGLNDLKWNKQMDTPRQTYTLKEATRKMERYCAYQERCHQEVAKKLARMNMIPQAIDQIMTHLIKNDFLNEERFARGYARGKFHQKNWGKRRIVMELKRRQLSRFNIQNALRELDKEPYEEVLHKLAVRKLGQISDRSILKKKRKLADYLLYRGWEPELVYDKVRELVP